MVSDAAAVALAAAAFWSMSMVLSKRGLEFGGDALLVALVVAVVDAVLYWPVLAVVEGGAVLAGLTPAGVGVFVLAGVVGTGVGRLASFTAIDRVGASVNSAAVSTRPLFATALAFLFLGEAVGPVVGAGIVVLVVGLVVLSLSRGGDVRGWAPHELLFSLLAAGSWAVADVVRRFGLTTTPATALHGVAVNEAAGVVVLGAYLLARRPAALGAVPRRSLAFFVGAGLLNACSFLLFFVALDLGPVAIVTSLVGVASLFTVAFAYLLLGDLERITPGIVVGAGLVVVGAAAITLA